VNAWKGSGWALSGRNQNLLVAFWGIWLAVSLFTRKFRLRPGIAYWTGVWAIVRSGLYLAYLMAVMVVILGEYKLSRGQVLWTCLVLAGLEWGAFTLLYGVLLKRTEERDKAWRSEVAPVEHPPLQSSGATGQAKRGPGSTGQGGQRIRAGVERISPLLLLIDMGLVTSAFLIVNFLKRGHFSLLPGYETLLMLIYGTWFVCSAVTDKFRLKPYANFYHALWPWLKAAALLFLTLALIVFLFRLAAFSRTQVFGTVVALAVLETLLVALYVARRQQRREKVDIESLTERQQVLRQQKLPPLNPAEIQAWLLTPVREPLRDRIFADRPEVFDLLDEHLDLRSIIRAEMVIRNSPDMLPDLDMLENRPMRLFINLHKVNDIRWLNRYFLELHNRLVPHGYLVVMAHTIETHREWMFQRYPRVLALILYLMDFVIHRVAPKLPWIKQVYFSATKGRDRRISRAEVLGRLRFCGFEIVAEKVIQKRLYVVAQKLMTPSLNGSPTYGPLVTLKRLGQHGEVLSIYKFRTMHPYSEFIQDYAVAQCGLLPGGKVRDDFRLTEWGKVMRRLWLDELPTIYNLLKGDLQLFGVRPLSAQYFDMYPRELQVLRMRVKPGLVPPFYADMPETFEEICASERRYIEAYLKRPVRTQVRYFWRAVWNIVVNGARSG